MAVQLARPRARNLTVEGGITSRGSRLYARGKVPGACGRGDVLLTPDPIVPLSLGGGNYNFN